MSAKITAKDISLVVLSGALMLLALPKFDLEILAWICFVPWLRALEGKSPRDAFLLSYVTGLVIFSGMTYWIWTVHTFRVIDFILLAGYFPHYASLWGLGVAWVRQRTGLAPILIAPSLWVALEYLRSHFFFLSAPWMLLGHSQYLQPSLIQLASVTGVYGLSFLIVFVNVALADALVHARRAGSIRSALVSRPRPVLLALLGGGALLALTNLYGLAVLRSPSTSDEVTLALIQGNISGQIQWDAAHRQRILDRYARLTRQAAAQHPRLIVWPESAVPGDVQHEPALRDFVSRLAEETGTYLLVGSSEKGKFVHRELAGQSYNSLFLFSPEGTIVGQYRKIGLVPFGEYAPLEGVVQWPKFIVATVGRTLPGTDYTIFSVDGARFGAVICWENIFPDLFREFVRRGARLMISSTNESWFDDTAAPYQLLAMTVFRAAENRVAIARAANTGITAIIDPFGRIIERFRSSGGDELFVEGMLVRTVPLAGAGTFYTRYGDFFAFLNLVVCGFLAALALRHTAHICSAGLPQPEEVSHVASATPHARHPG